MEGCKDRLRSSKELIVLHHMQFQGQSQSLRVGTDPSSALYRWPYEMASPPSGRLGSNNKLNDSQNNASGYLRARTVICHSWRNDDSPDSWRHQG